jgi:hypothetical protein
MIILVIKLPIEPFSLNDQSNSCKSILFIMGTAIEQKQMGKQDIKLGLVPKYLV